MKKVDPQERLGKLYSLVGQRVVLLPIPYGTKGPIFKGWQKATFKGTQKSERYQSELKAACAQGGNIGVLLGPNSGGICAIDIDTDDEVEAFLKLNPKLAGSLRTRGAVGCQIWIKIIGPYPERVIRSPLKIPGTDKSVAEWRGGGGGQSVILGKHKNDGVFYRFLVEAPAIEIAFGEIKWPERWGMSFNGGGGAKQRRTSGAKRGRTNDAAAGELSPERADRIWQYIKKVNPAVSGKGGSNPTYRLANVLVWGFGLSVEQARPFMTMYSMTKCVPPWSDKDIDHKLEDALKADHGDKPRGHLWGEEEPDDFSGIDLEPAPKPKLSEEALYGILGEITRFILPQSESDPAAIFSQLLVTFGSCVGRKAFFQVEMTKHHANLFAVMVGRTSKARKGTSLDYTREIITKADLFFATQFVSGLSSGEGLIFAVRDPTNKDDGVPDKRALVIETEFARPLKVMGRTGNTLSTVLRDAWDKGDLRITTRNDPVRATGAHIAMIGHVTEDELERELPECDYFNGFANRFLWVEVERSKLLPDGGKISPEVIGEYSSKLGQILIKAGEVGQMTRDAEAQEHWRAIYGDLTAGCSGMLGSATSRAEAQVLRISMILALTDGSSVITLAHQKAALAFWGYCFQSARRLFGRRASDPKAQKILNELRRRPEGMTRKQISEEIFERNLDSNRIDCALRQLLELKLAIVRIEPTGGRSAERWFAT